MKIRFIGPAKKRRLELRNGTAWIIERGEMFEISDVEGEHLVNEGGWPRMFEAVDAPSARTVEKKPRQPKEET